VRDGAGSVLRRFLAEFSPPALLVTCFLVPPPACCYHKYTFCSLYIHRSEDIRPSYGPAESFPLSDTSSDAFLLAQWYPDALFLLSFACTRLTRHNTPPAVS
jgi:hypothetical protein